jgi:hypothetical protein
MEAICRHGAAWDTTRFVAMSDGLRETVSPGGIFERLLPHPKIPLVAGIIADRPEVHVLGISDEVVVVRSVITTSSEPYPTESWLRMSRIPTAAWHPDEPMLVVTTDEGLMRWTPEAVTPLPGPPTDGSYRWLAVDETGSRLWASPAAGDDDWESSEIFDLATGGVSDGPRWDTDVVAHPGKGLVATLNSDQGATIVLFATTRGGAHAELVFLDRALILDADGYEAPLFSPDGSRFAIRGNAYEQSLEVFDLVTLRRVFGTVLGDPSPGYPYPDDWQAQFRSWSRNNVAWTSPKDLLVGTPRGSIVRVDVLAGDAQVTHELGSAVCALTACADGMVLVSLADGDVRRIAPATPTPADLSSGDPAQVVGEFLDTCTEVAAAEMDDVLRLSDGLNEWQPGDLEAVTSANSDDPTWLQLQAFMNTTRAGGA